MCWIMLRGGWKSLFPTGFRVFLDFVCFCCGSFFVVGFSCVYMALWGFLVVCSLPAFVFKELWFLSNG